MAGEYQVTGHHPGNMAIPAIAEIFQQPWQGILAFTDHNIIRKPGHLPRAGRCMRATDYGETVSSGNLVPVQGALIELRL